MTIRKRSPRYPSMSLEDALKRVADVYKKNGMHPVAAGAAAQAMGYKNATSGAAATTMASLNYYGLIDRGDKVAVSPDYEKYIYAPDSQTKASYVFTWLTQPKVYSDLYKKYGDAPPAEPALRYELMQDGFKPEAANDAVKYFMSSLEFARQSGALVQSKQPQADDTSKPESDNDKASLQNVKRSDTLQHSMTSPDEGHRAVLIFLPKNREATIYVPRPFFKKDKVHIARQIEALLADDEEEDT